MTQSGDHVRSVAKTPARLASLAESILDSHPYTGMPDGPPLCTRCTCRDCCEEHPHIVQWPCVTARKVLTHIGVKWRVSDGVGHLYRRDGAEWPDVWITAGIEEWAS